MKDVNQVYVDMEAISDDDGIKGIEEGIRRQKEKLSSTITSSTKPDEKPKKGEPKLKS